MPARSGTLGAMATATAPPGTKLWSPDLETYQRMAELEIFGDERVELLDGVLVAMSPKGAEHEQALSYLTRRAFDTVDRRSEIRIQFALTLAEGRVPEPDLAIVPPEIPRPYHPANAALVCEVAATSLRTDRTTKLAIYARARIPEYWIVDVNGLTLEVHTDPEGDTYRTTAWPEAGLVEARFCEFSVPLDELWAATTRSY